jgi:hypothetical protein
MLTPILTLSAETDEKAPPTTSGPSVKTAAIVVKRLIVILPPVIFDVARRGGVSGAP